MHHTYRVFQVISRFPDLLSQIRQMRQTLTREALLSLLEQHPAVLAEIRKQEGEGDPLSTLTLERLLGFITRDFSHLHLEGANLEGLPLDGTTFFQASLRGATLRHASLRRANLTLADLTEANLSGVDADEAGFDRAVLVEANVQQGRFRHVSFQAAQLLHCDLSCADLGAARLVEADLTGVEGAGVQAQWAVFARARLSESRWDRAHLTGARFQGATMSKTRLWEADLDHACFDEARMDQANLSGSSCWHASFFRTSLQGANLRGSTLNLCNFNGSDLSGARLRASTTTWAVFASIQVSAETEIEKDSRELLSAVLLASASNFEEQMFAAAIRESNLCWEGLTQELRKRPHLLPWVEKTLTPFASLQERIRVARSLLVK